MDTSRFFHTFHTFNFKEGSPKVMLEPGNHEVFLDIFGYSKKSRETSLLLET